MLLCYLSILIILHYYKICNTSLTNAQKKIQPSKINKQGVVVIVSERSTVISQYRVSQVNGSLVGVSTASRGCKNGRRENFKSAQKVIEVTNITRNISIG